MKTLQISRLFIWLFSTVIFIFWFIWLLPFFGPTRNGITEMFVIWPFWPIVFVQLQGRRLLHERFLVTIHVTQLVGQFEPWHSTSPIVFWKVQIVKVYFVSWCVTRLPFGGDVCSYSAGHRFFQSLMTRWTIFFSCCRCWKTEKHTQSL